MTVIKFGWIQFICIYFLLWWVSEHFLRCVMQEQRATEERVERHTSLIPHYTSCVTRHTSHVTRHPRYLIVHKVIPVRHVPPQKAHND